MRIKGLILLCFFFILGIFVLWDQNSAPLRILPMLSFEDARFEEDVCFRVLGVDQQQVCLFQHRGQLVVINFWASWCVPCIEELPLIFEFAQAHRDEVSVFLLSGDRRVEDAVTFLDTRFGAQGGSLQHLSSNLFVGFDENSALAKTRFSSFRYPETFVVSQDQNSMAKIIGELSPLHFQDMARSLP